MENKIINNQTMEASKQQLESLGTNEKRGICLPMINVDEIQLPFVEGSFVTKDGQVVTGAFLIDSGSNKSILNFRAVKYINDDCLIDAEAHLNTINGKGETCKKANVTITLGDVTGSEEFCISHNVDFRATFGNGIIGMLGVEYLCKHNWVLDFEKRCLRHDDGEVDFEQKAFLFPMEFGLQKYLIPVVGLTKDDKDYVFIADSGCDINTTTQYAANNAMEIVEQLDGQEMVKGIFGTEEVAITKAHFSMFCIGKEDGGLRYFDEEDTFRIIKEKQYLMEGDDDDVQPVAGLIGTNFMLRHKWVLDFHNEMIYSSGK